MRALTYRAAWGLASGATFLAGLALCVALCWGVVRWAASLGGPTAWQLGLLAVKLWVLCMVASLVLSFARLLFPGADPDDPAEPEPPPSPNDPGAVEYARQLRREGRTLSSIAREMRISRDEARDLVRG